MTSLLPLDLEGHPQMTCAVGSLLMYLIDTQKSAPEQIKELTIRQRGSHMQLDRSTLRNLELLETIYDHDVKGSLLGVLGKTKTAMGGRLLRQWLREPLRDSSEINRRLDAVGELRSNAIIANNISNSLRSVYDFQRLTAAISAGRANARDLIALKTTLAQLPDIHEQLDYLEGTLSEGTLLREISEGISDFDDLHNMIDRSICEEPPHIITEGGLIKAGYSEELDELCNFGLMPPTADIIPSISYL